MDKKFLPENIFKYLSKKVLGQDDVLRKISVAVFKHISGIKSGHIFLIGNSGTGKTTIMRSIGQFYSEHDTLAKFRVMAITNANTLIDEEGNVNTFRLFKNLETNVRNMLGVRITEEKMREYMENATICIDEVDKISSRVSGKVNASGILIQQSLLTLLEGENVLYETDVYEDGQQKTLKTSIDTSKILFICGGAFEELYEQVYGLISKHSDERRFKEDAQMDEKGGIRYIVRFKLKQYVKLSDLFTYGMFPQFISRFGSIAILDDLSKNDLKQIMLNADDSPFRNSQEYFKAMGIDLRMADDALSLIVTHALENTRIGARALREVFSRIIANLEFDPSSSKNLTKSDSNLILTIDKETVRENLTR